MFKKKVISKFNILIVEDNDETFKELKEVLAGTNYKLWRVSTGSKALKLAKDINFMVIISELLLFDINGIELVKKFKKISRQTNIIMLTAYMVSNELAVNAMKEGAFAYLQKPLNGEEVKLVLERAMENRVLLSQVKRKDYYQVISRLDGLTGLYNYRYLQQALDGIIRHLRRFPQTFSFFMIDIDYFKKYNDTKGHFEGDKVLCSLARLLEQSVRGTDMIFRYGGEEFSVILPQTQSKDAEKVGQRMIESARKKIPVTISMGLAAFPTHSQTKEGLIVGADKALYRAKESGRNRICVFDEKIDK
ncbi:MAG: diguanylate cyclase [Candidatus Omnitrophica bacterium]|nr:diguanylate cyclase [Candidatus Omnitrophota bacterium]